MYRFSLSWTRILPTGYNHTVNQKGVDYYHRLIDELLANGIQPMVTLFHWDLPQSLQNIGGWTNPAMPDYFKDFADIAFREYGDKVKWWITINEIELLSQYAYGEARHAPGLGDHGVYDYLSTHHMLRGHAKVYRHYQSVYKPRQQGKVSLAHAAFYMIPFDETSSEDQAAAERANQFHTEMYTHPIFSSEGDYPQFVRDRVDHNSKLEGRKNSRLPYFTAQEIEELKGNTLSLRIAFRISSRGCQLNPTDGSYSIRPSLGQHQGWTSFLIIYRFSVDLVPPSFACSTFYSERPTTSRTCIDARSDNAMSLLNQYTSNRGVTAPHNKLQRRVYSVASVTHFSRTSSLVLSISPFPINWNETQSDILVIRLSSNTLQSKIILQRRIPATAFSLQFARNNQNSIEGVKYVLRVVQILWLFTSTFVSSTQIAGMPRYHETSTARPCHGTEEIVRNSTFVEISLDDIYPLTFLRPSPEFEGVPFFPHRDLPYNHSACGSPLLTLNKGTTYYVGSSTIRLDNFYTGSVGSLLAARSITHTMNITEILRLPCSSHISVNDIFDLLDRSRSTIGSSLRTKFPYDFTSKIRGKPEQPELKRLAPDLNRSNPSAERMFPTRLWEFTRLSSTVPIKLQQTYLRKKKMGSKGKEENYVVTSGTPEPNPSINRDAGVTILDYKLYPVGLRRLLNFIRTKYDNPPVFITESGCEDSSEFYDTTRIEYFHNYLEQVLLAINEDGCNVIGYTAWSLMDNFEWNRAYSVKYGLWHVDFNSTERTRKMKLSGYYFKKMTETMQLPSIPFYI
ncbi:hypothetical protein J6590_057838 [Homalodisca vitripennis]|nr:hypothetical protein J6590_057838 [Homalodisca vitripennis]